MKYHPQFIYLFAQPSVCTHTHNGFRIVQLYCFAKQIHQLERSDYKWFFFNPAPVTASLFWVTQVISLSLPSFLKWCHASVGQLDSPRCDCLHSIPASPNILVNILKFADPSLCDVQFYGFHKCIESRIHHQNTIDCSYVILKSPFSNPFSSVSHHHWPVFCPYRVHLLCNVTWMESGYVAFRFWHVSFSKMYIKFIHIVE